MSMLFAYMAGGEEDGGGGLEVLKNRGFVCVGVGGGVRFSTSSSVKKINDPPPINK